ncbi:TetR family transcriptional regulator [Streptomyces sp. G5(2025)]|uniref:TetR family transcriptional regulator n=1 Tax=Streptomyces sp. G5(2025) TaxID=3406628 RepID=UPI003C274E59
MRTRHALLVAAAEQIDRHGYDGTSLVRVCRAAGISMGALTFHFPAKDKLADALQEQGRSATEAVVNQALAIPASPLRRARALVLAVARLLQTHTEVRAAARLARERLDTDADWAGSWLPPLRDLLEQAHAEGQLRTTADPETVTVTAAYLIAGVDSHVRQRAHAPDTGAPHLDAAGQLARVWDLLLYGAATAPPRPSTSRDEGTAGPTTAR